MTPPIDAIWFRIRAATRLAWLVGVRHLRLAWNSHTIAESFEGGATPLEAAAYLTLQNIPRLPRRARVDTRLRRHIQNGRIRRGVLANGYPEQLPQQQTLFSGQEQEFGPQQVADTASTSDLMSLIEEVSNEEERLLSLHTDDMPGEEYDEEDYDEGPRFLYGLITGACLALLLPLWWWMDSQVGEITSTRVGQYSPQVVKVAASRGQDCTRAKDLYSQLYCGELWRKELSARLEQTFTDLLAVSTAIDEMHRRSGLEVERPLAERVRQTHRSWALHVESSCNTTAAVVNLGGQASSRYLDCVHQRLLDRETELREQLNHLRGLGWNQQADEVLNNELIAIHNLNAANPEKQGEEPGQETEEETEEEQASTGGTEITAGETQPPDQLEESGTGDE